MPFVSLAQEGWAHEHPKEFGEANLKEWDEATKGMHLPENVPHEARKALLVNHHHFHHNKGDGPA